MIGMVAWSAVDKPMNLLSVELSAISVWSCDAQRIGQPVYMMMYPCLDWAVSQDLASEWFQLPEKLASM